MDSDNDGEGSPKIPEEEERTIKLPTDDKLVEVILDIMQEKGEVPSLRKMTDLVNKKLEIHGYEKHTTPSRLKRLIVNRKLATIKVQVRRRDGHGLVSKCPVCGHGLRNEKNITIYGWMITLKQVCPECGYWTDRKKTSVAKYFFSSLSKENDD